MCCLGCVEQALRGPDAVARVPHAVAGSSHDATERRRTTAGMVPRPDIGLMPCCLIKRCSRRDCELFAAGQARTRRIMATATKCRMGTNSAHQCNACARPRCVLERLLDSRRILLEPAGRVGGVRPNTSWLGLFRLSAAIHSETRVPMIDAFDLFTSSTVTMMDDPSIDNDDRASRVGDRRCGSMIGDR